MNPTDSHITALTSILPAPTTKARVSWFDRHRTWYTLAISGSDDAIKALRAEMEKLQRHAAIPLILGSAGEISALVFTIGDGRVE